MLEQPFADGGYIVSSVSRSSSVETHETAGVLSAQPSTISENSTTSRTETISSIDDNNNTKSVEEKRKHVTISPIKLKAIYRRNIALKGASTLIGAPKTTLYRRVAKELQRTVDEAKQSIDKNKMYILHFDGKSFFNKNERLMMERNCYVVSRTDIPQTQILGVPFLEDGKGVTIARKGAEIVNEWGITDCILGLSMDTTATNTGCHNGACVLMKDILGKELIWFPCRHHVAELVLKITIQPWEGKSSAPDTQQYVDFKKKWDQRKINKSNYKPYFDGSKSAEKKRKNIEKHFNINSIVEFIEAQLKKQQVRSDYKELLILALTFLGKLEPTKITPPGNTSKARWMQRAIYSLKMFLFRKEPQAEIEKVELLEDICLFITFVYIPYWYDCTTATHALLNDIKFIEDMKKFKNINSSISENALKQFTGDHLWYMGYHLSALAFFDERISTKEKLEMKKHLHIHKKATADNNRRFKLSVKKKDYKICDYISKTTMHLFEMIKLDTSFLEKDPSVWANEESYKKSKQEIQYIQVVNDAGERALALIKNISFKDENKIQNTKVSIQKKVVEQ